MIEVSYSFWSDHSNDLPITTQIKVSKSDDKAYIVNAVTGRKWNADAAEIVEASLYVLRDAIPTSHYLEPWLEFEGASDNFSCEHSDTGTTMTVSAADDGQLTFTSDGASETTKIDAKLFLVALVKQMRTSLGLTTLVGNIRSIDRGREIL